VINRTDISYAIADTSGSWTLPDDIVVPLSKYTRQFMAKHNLRFKTERLAASLRGDVLLGQFQAGHLQSWKTPTVPNNHFELVPLRALIDDQIGGARDFFRGLDKLLLFHANKPALSDSFVRLLQQALFLEPARGGMGRDAGTTNTNHGAEELARALKHPIGGTLMLNFATIGYCHYR
jgi:hypothetical protein